MTEISGWFSDKSGHHIPIMSGQSKSDALKKFYENKYTKTTIKKMNKTGGRASNKSEKFKDSKGNEIEVKKATPKEFKDALDRAKASQPEDKAWRVDNYSHSLKDYSNDQLYITKNGATIAITKDGDIISVCNNTRGNKESMRAVMEFAISKGRKEVG